MEKRVTISARELLDSPGIDPGTIPRMLKAKGLKAKGCILPELAGVVTSWYDPKTQLHVYMQVT